VRIVLITAGLLTLGAALATSCGSTPGKEAQRDEGGAGGAEAADAGAGGASVATTGGTLNNTGGKATAGTGGQPTAGTSGQSAAGDGGQSTAGAGGQSAAGDGAGGQPAAGAGGDAGAGGACTNGCIPPGVVFNTGVDSTGAALPGGSVDPHYTLLTSAEATLPGPDAIVTSQIADGYWVAQSDTSKWIAPSANQAYPGADPCNTAGTYVYRTTFMLTAEQTATFKLLGQWGADNYGIDVLLNDVSLGITAASYNPLTAFSIQAGFVTGLNTLDFKINDIGCPNGLRVELTASTQ
jgi:Beta-galactosidase jelly roll domain